MNHLTIVTGHARASPREEVSYRALAACADLLQRGGGLIPNVGGAYHLSVEEPPPIPGGLLFAVRRGQAGEAIAACGVAATPVASAAVWASLRQYHDDQQLGVPACAPPGETPWLGVVLTRLYLLGLPASERRRLDWLADFERCVAWAWLDSVRVKEGATS